MHVGRRRRRIRSWARSTTRRAASSATTRSSGASPAAPTRAARRSIPTPRSPGLERANGRVDRGAAPTAADVEAGQVVNATAGWSTLICDMAGVPLPITTHILQACVTEPVKPLLDVVIVSSQMHVYISQTDRGEFVMGSEIEPWTTYRMNGTLNFLQDLTRHTLELFPQLEHARILRAWAGLCDLSPDYSPDPRPDRGRELPRQRGLGHLRLQGRADRRQDARRARRHGPPARPDRAVQARALLRGRARLRARRRRRQPLNPGGATTMKSSLEIAQEAELMPIEQIAEQCGLEPDEIEPYGRYKAKIDLSVLDRLARPARTASSICVTGMTPTKAGEGKTTTLVGLTQGLGAHRQAAGRVPARAVARPGVRHQGRRGRRRHDAGRADGGPQPPLHRRHPRHRRGEQPARGDARRVDPARQPAQDRPAARRLAPRARHERPRAAQRSRSASAAAPTATRARPGFDITAASEVMAILAVARDLQDLRARLGRDHGRRTRSTAASRSPPRTSARRARWRCCSRTRSSRT